MIIEVAVASEKWSGNRRSSANERLSHDLGRVVLIRRIRYNPPGLRLETI